MYFIHIYDCNAARNNNVLVGTLSLTYENNLNFKMQLRTEQNSFGVFLLLRNI